MRIFIGVLISSSLVFIVTGIISGYYIHKREETLYNNNLNEIIDRFVVEFSKMSVLYDETIKNFQKIMSSDLKLNQLQFVSLSSNIFDYRNNGISAIYDIPKIKHKNRAIFERDNNVTIRGYNSGMSNYSSTNYSSLNYYPIRFSNPHMPSLTGFDLGSVGQIKMLFESNYNMNSSSIFSVLNYAQGECDASLYVMYYDNQDHYLLILYELKSLIISVINNLSGNTNKNFILYGENNTYLTSNKNECNKSKIELMNNNNVYISQREIKFGNVIFDILMYDDEYEINYVTILLSLVIFIVPTLIVLLIGIIIYNNMKHREEQLVHSRNMLGYVNHELRNPLNGISGLVVDITENIKAKMGQIQEQNQSDTVYVQFERSEIESIHSDLNTVYGLYMNMGHIINDILDIRRLEEGRFVLNPRIILISEIIRIIDKSVKMKAQEKIGVVYITNCDENILKSSIFIDETKLSQILINFIINALKFTESGSVILNIALQNNKIKFEVVDTGRGIPDDKKNKIFKPFSQTEKRDASMRYGGIGLGLYLCKMLTNNMGGEIGFKSEYNLGSTFWVSFDTKILQYTNTNNVSIHIEQDLSTHPFDF